MVAATWCKPKRSLNIDIDIWMKTYTSRVAAHINVVHLVSCSTQGLPKRMLVQGPGRLFGTDSEDLARARWPKYKERVAAPLRLLQASNAGSLGGCWSEVLAEAGWPEC